MLGASSFIRLVKCQWANARERAEEAADIFDRLGDKRRLEVIQRNLGFIALSQGEFASSLRQYTEMYESACDRGNAMAQAVGLILMGIVALQLGLTEHTVTHLETAKDILPRDIDHSLEIILSNYLTVALVRQGKYRLASAQVAVSEDLISRSLSILDSRGGTYAPFVLYSTSMVFLVFRETNQEQYPADLEAIGKLARKASRSYHKLARTVSFAKPGDQLIQGLYNWLDGKRYKARRAWLRSVLAASKSGMHFEEGLAHFQIGRHLDLHDPNRIEHLTRACEIFENLDAAYDLTQARKELRT